MNVYLEHTKAREFNHTESVLTELTPSTSNSRLRKRGKDCRSHGKGSPPSAVDFDFTCYGASMHTQKSQLEYVGNLTGLDALR
jgi:hypothetical protein